MRVISGSARRLLLKSPVGLETRPTSDKHKETLFNILMPYIYSDTAFLDLFSGSGAIGIEALSRGAKEACFVEKSKAAVSCIKENLKTTGFTDNSTIFTMDVISALNQLNGRKDFDIIFMDPPFDNNFERDVLYYLSDSKLLREDGLVVVEASNNTNFDYIEDFNFNVLKYKEYKNCCHLFLTKEEK